MLSSLFLSFTVHADAPEEKEKPEEVKEGEQDEGGEEEAEPEVEEEEAEPEDEYPAVREQCQETTACSGYTKHFQHCQEKVEAGEGYKGEDCVEELCALLINYLKVTLLTRHDTINSISPVHMMHCVDNCAAPKLFSKLR